MSPSRKAHLNTIHEEGESCYSDENLSISLNDLALIDSYVDSEDVRMSELQEALSSEIKHKNYGNAELEEVKEEQENSYMSEIASLFSEKLDISQ
jgi:hypothetical protein